MNERLKIIPNDKNQNNQENFVGKKTSQRLETQAKFNRLWLTDPHQFNPFRNCMEKERLQRTWNLLGTLNSDLSGKLAVDLGCGSGEFSRMMRDKGTKVQAVDISTNALQKFQEVDSDNIKRIEDYVPYTKLSDDFYDIVISTDLIAWLKPEEHRLYMSELSRLVKPNGYVVCSTGIDINTEGALQIFGNLAETEFHNIEWIFSHHAFYIRFKDFFEAPQRFSKAAKDPEYRQKELEKRNSLYRWWFNLNSSPTLGVFWNIFQWVPYPIVQLLKNNRTILLTLEKICRFFKSESGISHVIFAGQRRPLVQPVPEEIPVERKHKKQVWE